MTISVVSPVFPFASPDGFSHPPLLAHLRAHEPVSKIVLPTGDPAWLVTRYDDVRFVLSDHRFSRALTTQPGAPRLTPVDLPVTILELDPPEHTRLRRLVAREFTSRRVEALRGRVQELTDTALDSMTAQGPPGDLHSALASTLPVNVICELLGVPYEDWPLFRGWSNVVISIAGYSPVEIMRARDSLMTYLGRLVAAKRARPGGDLLSALVAKRDEQDMASEEEIVSLGAFILVAGYESTVSQIGMGVLTLLRNTGQYAELAADPSLTPAVVEELLRVAGPGGGAFLRIATEDVQIAGVRIRAGEGVMAAVGSANRDETRFCDAARLDIKRADNAHVAFGYGVHRCLGAALARLELQVVIGALARRFPNLALAVGEEELAWRQGSRLPGLLALPVRW